MYNIDSFRLDLRKTTAPDNYIWTASGFGTCAPMRNTVAGVAGIFSPPIAAGDLALALTFVANGHAVPDNGSRGKGDVGLLFAAHEWRPDRIARRGTYHQRIGGALISFGVETELRALADAAGFVETIRIANRAPTPLAIRVDAALEAGRPALVPLSTWQFTPPGHGDEPAKRIAPDRWATSEIEVELASEAEAERILAPGADTTFHLAVRLSDRHSVSAGSALASGRPLAQLAEATTDAWQKRIALANENLPEIRSDIPGLEAYVRTSVMSGLVCIWENPRFATSPFIATSGVDGGSICCYPWDVAGYGAPFWTMLLGDSANDILRTMLGCGLDRHIAMAPDGAGVGTCSYSYSVWSAVRLYWTLALFRDPDPGLFDEVVRVFLADESRLAEIGGLNDYGLQHNLLEMRSCGYEHVVPSPNAERAWCYDRLAQIAARLGRAGFEAWPAKAESIRAEIRRRLWNPEIGWFRALHPGADGGNPHTETVYSIQCFDALRMGACTPDMKAGLVAHLREGAFLGRYGVSSVSAEDDIHYELNDPDWSGSGAYSGEGPELAETLWKNGEDDLAWDVLRRHFWMGETLPYFPQEHYCDAPRMPAHKRANIVAGVVGIEAILFGLAGISPQLDGTLRIVPRHLPANVRGTVEIRNFRHRGRSVNVTVTPP